MSRRKRKLTPEQKAEKNRRASMFMTIYLGGKAKRVPRPPTIDGMDVDEFIRRNADPIWLVQNEMWEYLDPEPGIEATADCRDDEGPGRDRRRCPGRTETVTPDPVQ